MSQIERAVASAGSWFVISYAAASLLGVPAGVAAIAESAAFVGAASLASDYAHGWLSVYPTTWTCSLGTGIANAVLLKAAKGSSDYTANVASGAVASGVGSYAVGMYGMSGSGYSEEDEASEIIREGGVSTQ